MGFLPRPFVSVLRALAAALTVATPAFATTVIPVPEPALTRDAAAIVIGHVLRIESHWDQTQQRVETDITISVDEVLKGQLAATEITLRQPGGRAAGLESWLEGSPEFERGEKVLVFVRQRPDGTLRVAHLFQGKFSIITDTATGEEHVHREARPAGVNVLGAGEEGARVTGRLEEMKARIRGRVTGELDRGKRDAIIAGGAAAVTSVTEERDGFTYLGSPSRWFLPDSGTPISMRINSNGEPRAPGGGFDQVRAGLNAWSSVATSRARFRDAGFTTAGGFRLDGVSSIAFRDPRGDIDPPSGCSGTLALGGYFRNGETRVVNGRTFYQIIEGDVVFADGWAGCNYYENFSNLAEVATHELGHVLGLGHSTATDAIMRAVARFDGRGARLGSDDIAGVSSMYPAGTSAGTVTLAVVRGGTGAGTVTSSPTGISCGTDCWHTCATGTAVTLTAAAASGSTFAGWSGGGCSGTGTCRVTVSAATTVTATFNRSTSTGSFTAAFSYPAAGATLRGNFSIGMKTSAPWGQSKRWTLAVDGTSVLTVTNTATVLWYTLDTRRFSNGSHTLRLTVTYNGTSVSTTRTVTIAN